MTDSSPHQPRPLDRPRIHRLPAHTGLLRPPVFVAVDDGADPVEAFNAIFGIAATGNVVSLAQERIVEATHRSARLASAAKKSGLVEYRRLYRDELHSVLEQVIDDPNLGEFAERLLNEMDGVAEAAVDRVAAISFDAHRAA